MRTLTRRNPGLPFLLPMLVLLFLTTLAPIVYVLVISVFDYYLPNDTVSFVGLRNYGRFLVDPQFWKAAGNTAVYAGASTVFHIGVAVALAMFLDRSGRRLGRVAASVRGILILPWLLSWAVAAALWRLILSPSGVLNAYLMQLGLLERQIAWFGTPGAAMGWIVAITVWKAFPFFFMLVYAAVTSVPQELYESAQIDGAGSFQQFFKITLPSIYPTVLTLVVLDVIWSLRQYDIIFLTTAGGPLNTTRTLTLQVYFSAYEQLRFGLAGAQGVFILVVASLLAFAYIVLYERLEDQR